MPWTLWTYPIMQGPHKGYTTPHRCVTVNSSRRNQPSDRDRQARQKLQEKTLDFQVTFYDCVYLSIEPEAKRDIYNTFDPIKTKSYKISSEMDIETMPHAMYFSGSNEAVTKINHVPYQTFEYDDKGMFQVKLMDGTQVQIFIDNITYMKNKRKSYKKKWIDLNI